MLSVFCTFFRTFLENSWTVAEKLLEWFQEGKLCDRVTRVLLLWVHNHFTDFEMDPRMMEFLERFERALESKKMNGQLNRHEKELLFVNIQTDQTELQPITQLLTSQLPYVELKRMDHTDNGLDLSFICKVENLQQMENLSASLKGISISDNNLFYLRFICHLTKFRCIPVD